jgi:chemotaxis methyl-accepting protein methylase
MHEFKRKILKDRANKIITNKNQALAIALTQSHTKCKREKEEVKKLLNKVNKDLISSKELNYTDVIETHDAIILLNKMKKNTICNKFKNLLLQKIIKQNINGTKLNINIWEEIKKIYI